MKSVTAPNQITQLVLKGYKSIAECDIKLGRLNVLIGANGAGKSNVIGVFRLISRILDRQLQVTVTAMGGADALLHFGRKTTEALQVELHFGANRYSFDLRPTQDNHLMFVEETLLWKLKKYGGQRNGRLESCMTGQGDAARIARDDGAVRTMRSWRFHHFHDTGREARVKQVHSINDNEYLRDDARNLAAFLYRLKQHHESHYERIVKMVRMITPFFGDFHLRPTVWNPETIQLEWTEAGYDVPFTASALSDGTLRFICLATVLLQPEEFAPTALIIDEPELGLHPYAIAVLAGLMRSASHRHQLIISTQSVELVNEFDAKDLIVVDKKAKASEVRRLDIEPLREWLAEYSLGELWKKNLLGGRPT